MLPLGLGLGLGFALVCLGAIPFLGIVAAIAIPNFVAMQQKAKRAEAPANVEGIRTAEMAYEAAFGVYLPCGDRGPAERILGKDQHPWSEDPAAKCFEQLGWSPDGNVRGAYFVTVDNVAHDFVVHGVIDVDGDGDVAEYRATSTGRTMLFSSPDVY